MEYLRSIAGMGDRQLSGRPLRTAGFRRDVWNRDGPATDPEHSTDRKNQRPKATVDDLPAEMPSHVLGTGGQRMRAPTDHDTVKEPIQA